MIRNGVEITEENWQENAGQLGIWYTEPLTEENRDLLYCYAKDVKPRARFFIIRIEPVPRMRKSYQSEQLIKLLGKLPVEEVLVTSWADYMFMAMEEVMRHLGGWAHFGFSVDENDPLEDENLMAVRRSRNPRPGRYNLNYYLVNHHGLSRTMNEKVDLSVRYDCSFRRFLEMYGKREGR